VPATKLRVAAHRLRRVDDDQPFGRYQHPRALPELAQIGNADEFELTPPSACHY
jgi:hypothetical protein